MHGTKFDDFVDVPKAMLLSVIAQRVQVYTPLALVKTLSKLIAGAGETETIVFGTVFLAEVDEGISCKSDKAEPLNSHIANHYRFLLGHAVGTETDDPLLG